VPSYIVYSAEESLTGEQRADLARAITALHSEHTGAPKSFVQTVFLPVAPGGHFIGARPADPRCVWIRGDIRGGRAAKVRTALADGIAAAAERVAGIPRQYVWVYLNELAHTDMIEFGSVLPVPGEEAAWIDAMDPEARDYLRSLG
jgi:phenylpyruvate tautomerase PptA (4-oxalocrotonate tautomerase family)